MLGAVWEMLPTPPAQGTVGTLEGKAHVCPGAVGSGVTEGQVEKGVITGDCK